MFGMYRRVCFVTKNFGQYTEYFDLILCQVVLFVLAVDCDEVDAVCEWRVDVNYSNAASLAFVAFLVGKAELSENGAAWDWSA